MYRTKSCNTFILKYFVMLSLFCGVCITFAVHIISLVPNQYALRLKRATITNIFYE